MACVSVVFPLLGEPLALDLANTVVREHGELRDLLAEPAGIAAWLAAQGERLGDEAPPDAEWLLRLREAVRELLAAADEQRAPAPSAAETITATARSARPELVGEATGPSVRWLAVRAPHQPGAATLARIAHSALALIDAGAGPRRCANPACVLRFAAGDARRRFCVARTCGNRVRQARHRARAQAS